MAYYLDTSALVKLVVREAESTALRSWIEREGAVLVSSDLARTELMRAVSRASGNYLLQARLVLDSITILTISTAIFESAGRLSPSTLRTLDALHLASALELGDDLEALITYDDRLADACMANGIPTLSPNS